MQRFDVSRLTEACAEYISVELIPEHSIAFCPALRTGRAGEGMAIAV